MINYKQAAAIPYRINKDNFQILLITSRNGKKWIIPKGIIEEGDSAVETAERETKEEAGVVGKADSVEGEYTYKKWDGICTVKVFPMLVTGTLQEWDEQEIRSRKWFETDDALKKVKSKKLRQVLKQFIKSKKYEMAL